jgi:ribosomal protein S18 acetylase RimI-like enzyme
VSTTLRHPLDNPAWASLLGAHARFGEFRGEAARYDGEVAPFAAVPDNASAACWTDLAGLFGPGARLVLADAPDGTPSDWTLVDQTHGLQLTGEGLAVEPDPDAVVLGPPDVPAMLDLVGRTKPGPFLPRTIELGRYLGIRVGAELVAMAGERLQPPGWTEISAVCTDERYRGRGLAARLVRAVGHGIRERGNLPFLHAAARNTSALRLYESLGFTIRRTRVFTVWRLPG